MTDSMLRDGEVDEAPRGMGMLADLDWRVLIVVD